MSMFSMLMWGAACLKATSAIRSDDVDKLVSNLGDAGESKQESLLQSESSKPKVLPSIKNVLVRGCVDDHALKHAELTKEANVDDRVSDVAAALAEYFEREDQTIESSTFATQRAARRAHNAVKKLGFSIRASTSQCTREITQPFQSVVEDCILSIANSGETRAWGWKGWMYQKGAAIKQVVSAEGNLTELLMRRFVLQGEKHLLAKYSTMKYILKNVRSSIKWRAVSLKSLDIAIKAHGFKLPATKKFCENHHKDDTLSSYQEIIDRISAELKLPAGFVDGECQEVSGLTCPAGTSPQVLHEFQTKRSLESFGLAFGLWTPIGQPLVFASAWAIGGLTFGLQMLAAASVPGFGVFVAAPIGLLAGVPFKGECMCGINECEYSETLDACAMSNSDTSSYEFEYLPYPGTKCLPTGGTCELALCTAEDLSTPIEGFTDQEDNVIFGKVGVSRSDAGAGTYNCLGTSPDVMGQIALLRKVPDLTHPDTRNGEDDTPVFMVNNTQDSRTNLYQTLLDSED